jgi:hypothetical protein
MSEVERLKSIVAAAKTHVKHCQTILHYRMAEVRGSLTPEEVLTDLPNLLEFLRAPPDVPRLERESAEKATQLQQERWRLLDELRNRRLNEAEAENPLEFNRLREERDYCGWLHRELRPGSDLRGLLAHPRVRPPDRDAVKRALASQTPRNAVACLKDRLWNEMRTVCEAYDRLTGCVTEAELEPLIRPLLSPFLQEAEIAWAAVDRARAVEAELARAENVRTERVPGIVEKRTQVERDKLQQAEAALAAAEADLEDALKREAEEGQRREQDVRRKEAEGRKQREEAWWLDFPTRPVCELIPRLQGLSDERAEAALDFLLSLGVGDAYLHDEEVQAFIRRECGRRIGRRSLLSPAFIAVVGQVSLTNRHEARRLLGMMPAAVGQPLESVIAYLDFVTDDRPSLAGNTSFSSLKPIDFYLAACYWDGAGATLDGIAGWDYRSIEGFLSGPGETRSKDLHTFQVKGCQPRIAELALREVCRMLQGEGEADSLIDLNVATIGEPPPAGTWKLAEDRRRLPGADWKDHRGRHYDAKCNLFFRSKQQKEGLRGLYIRINNGADTTHHYPGFVFFESDDWGCSWCYIGTYRHKDSVESDRVSPFLFRLPKRHRFEAKGCDAAERLLNDPSLRLGWRLATRSSRTPPGNPLLGAFLSRCAGTAAKMDLEEALWRCMTEVTLEGCSNQGQACVDDFLLRMENLVHSRAMPLHLPSLRGVPLLMRWIDDVLRPITAHWARISCPTCGRTGAEPGNIRLSDIQMTAEGSIDANLTCLGCGPRRNRVRVLTHCHTCHQYPLLIGANEVCGDCGGLVCHGECGCCNSCKHPDCPGFFKRQKDPANQPRHGPVRPEYVSVTDLEYDDLPF